jgi:NYN domain/OST-HTH/LOTUS domain
MAELNNKDLRLAVLIDADNVPSRSIKEMMEEMSKYGTPTFKRIYGDWTNTALSGWKQVLNEHAIVPVQQFSYTSGKNSTDSALIIDAMDILYTRRVDGFFIVSSDSDFTRLATRLREEGMRVFGMGERKTAAPFIKACEKFIYIEVLRPEPVAARNIGKGQPVQKAKAFRDPELEALVISTIEDMADDAGWVDMGGLGNGLLKKRSDFDPRNYGFKKLTDLIMAMHGVVVEARSTGQGNVKHYYLRLKS